MLTCLQGILVVALLCMSGCASDTSKGQMPQDAAPTSADAQEALDAPIDAATTCTPGPESVKCVDGKQISFCTTDANFDGMPDGAATTVAMTCSAFFRNAGAGSCEPATVGSADATCTMDDGGPCGVVVITGRPAAVRCTTNDAVCILNLAVANYTCTTGSGFSCSPAGTGFVPYCRDNKLVWRCTDDGDGTPQPHIDDCTMLGNGTCDASSKKCLNIQAGGRCNATEWICAQGLRCTNNKCVAM